MSFFVYIIYSPRLQRFYTSTTDDAAKRFEEHNSNKYLNSFTSKEFEESFSSIFVTNNDFNR